MGGEARKSAALPKIMRTAFGIETLQAAAIETADALGDPQFAPELLALARSDAATPEIRVAAVDVVGRARNVEHAGALEALAAAGPVPVRVAALRARGLLGGADARPGGQALVLRGAPNGGRFATPPRLAPTPAGLPAILRLAEPRPPPGPLTRLAP